MDQKRRLCKLYKFIGSFSLSDPIGAKIKISNREKICKKKYIEKLPQGLNTQLGSKFDKGIQLSGGEWQQVSFLRSIVKSAELYIFDEPSSALDVITEENMYRTLREYGYDSICILVTHRLYIVNDYATRAIVFQDGTVIEDDKIEKLLLRDSNYKSMLNKVKKIDLKGDY